MDTSFEDLGADSLDIVELTMAVEEEFGLEDMERGGSVRHLHRGAIWSATSSPSWTTEETKRQEPRLRRGSRFEGRIDMEALEEKLGYTVSNRAFLENALTHSSYANENKAKGLQSNERLEFLGDSVLGMVVADYLFRTHPDLPEGDLTRTRAALVCEGSLVEVAQCLELGAYLKLGKGEEAGGGRERPSIIADAVEAVLAAVYLDGGIGSARKLIQKFILDREAEKSASRDYKTALQELVQRESGQVLGYQLIGAEGPDHAKIFSVEVDLNGIPIGQGRGRSKKEAEQNAARAAIEKLRAGE